MTEARRLVPISARWILKRIIEGKTVRLKYALINEGIELSNLDLPTFHVERTDNEISYYNLKEDVKVVASRIIITYSRFKEEFDCNNIIFREQIDFSNTIFSSHVNFLGAQFFGKTNFKKTFFCGDDFVPVSVDFTGSIFNGSAAYFDSACFKHGALFTAVQFNKRDLSRISASFDGAKFLETANLGGEFSRFYNPDLFVGAPVSFLGAIFEGGALFRNTIFKGDINFIDARFNGGADFRGAKFFNRINLTISKFNGFYIRWLELKDSLYYDGPTYLELIKNFKILELWDDAESCYYQYRRIAQKKKSWRSWSKLLDIIAWTSCGYGVKAWPIPIWMIILVTIFGLLYGSSNGLTGADYKTLSIIVINIAPTVFQSTPYVEIPARIPWSDIFYFSAATFAGIMPTDLHPIGNWKYIVMIERLAGYLFLTLFVVVLTKKFIR